MMRTGIRLTGQRLARVHGVANVVSGAWPLLHMRSFEAVTGPKADRWLVRTVAGLLVANGSLQWWLADRRDGVRTARAIGIGTSGVLATIDWLYAPQSRISTAYLLDALYQSAWVAVWLARPWPELAEPDPVGALPDVVPHLTITEVEITAFGMEEELIR
jgi:hypothetical protein